MPFDEAAHPRAESGATGGQFVAADQGPTGKSVLGLKAKGATMPSEKGGGGGKGAGKGAKKPRPKPKGRTEPKKKPAEFAADMTPAQTKTLQQALAKAGLKGADGKPLKITGKLDADTVKAIKAAQRKYGMKPTGRPTATLIRRLAKPRMTKKQLADRRPKFAAGVPIAGGR